MADVEFSDSDFAEAISHLLDAGDAPVDTLCVAFGALGSTVVESAVGSVDALVRHAVTALVGVGDDLSADVSTVHTELLALDAQMAGTGG
ncbi:hypothetical protein [Microbacterium sp. CPCC 204701]|uniref:hypothetical protein n=1 Tax=Microbacterium sp. CPCC 204701 TaxID=2493084 RepID=UPI000FD8C112|nr:hypothetical protein [Microbacterium sp. CPCC 204701]